ncbi:hypothetical protein DENSPDRAFT_833229 [Dentipellis sp. KUC8613]|nr:hypothetical protein DENSPDRAFT_833229 [Dentipellis sp. KUC8613]
MTVDAPKLTKKQKKALAFRGRKGKGKGGDDADELSLAVPVAEDQDLADAALDEGQGAARVEEGAGQRRGAGRPEKVDDGQQGGQGKAVAAKSKKRKRDAEGESGLAGEAVGGGAEKHGVKKRKKQPAAEGGEGKDAGGDADAEKVDMKDKSKQQRLILFLGNLKYTTTREAIAEHFAVCDPPPTIRLLNPKQTRPGATVTKSKGCAFLEFSARPALQQALKLHHSELDGRQINVELTAGGGGKSEARIAKLKERNKELAAQRMKKLQKQGASNETGSFKPQRFSATSGEGDAPKAKRTWAVEDVDDGQTHRGGKNAKKRGKRPNAKAREWGTGVNAIPVG